MTSSPIRALSKQVVADFLSRSTDPKELLYDEIHRRAHLGYLRRGRLFPVRAGRPCAIARRGHAQPRGVSQLVFRASTCARAGFRVAFYGATGGHFAGVTSIASLQQGVRRLVHQCAGLRGQHAVAAGGGTHQSIPADVLWGYTTALKMLGEEQRAGRLDIKPVAVAATGEMVTTADMQIPVGRLRRRSRFQHLCLYRTHDVGDFEPRHDTMTLIDDDLVFEFYEDHSVITISTISPCP